MRHCTQHYVLWEDSRLNIAVGYFSIYRFYCLPYSIEKMKKSQQELFEWRKASKYLRKRISKIRTSFFSFSLFPFLILSLYFPLSLSITLSILPSRRLSIPLSIAFSPTLTLSSYLFLPFSLSLSLSMSPSFFLSLVSTSSIPTLSSYLRDNVIMTCTQSIGPTGDSIHIHAILSRKVRTR